MRRTLLLLPALTVLLAIGCAARANVEEVALGPQDRTAGGGGGSEFSTGLVIIGDDTVKVEVARTGAERGRGLMYRTEVPPGTGMLFVFPDEEVRSFWMQNTPVSLDIAFLDAELLIVDIQQMEADSHDFHESRGRAMYALEVPQGWFAEHGIRVGDRAQVVFEP